MKAMRCFSVATFLACGIVHAQEPPLTILSIPLGKAMDRPIAECAKLRGQPQTDYCSRFGEFNPKPRLEVFLDRPPAGASGISLPDWLRKLSVFIGDDGSIVRILAITNGPSSQRDIIEAIASRFGPPTQAAERDAQNAYGTKWRVTNAVWDLSAVHISHNCFQMNECSIFFETPAEHERTSKEREEKKIRNKV